MPVCVYDMLSILLQARSYDPSDYKPGVKILFSMATGRAIEKQTLIIEEKKTSPLNKELLIVVWFSHW